MKKKLTLIILALVSVFMLVGCSNSEEKYNEDQTSIKGIAEVNELVEDTYAEARKLEDPDVINKFDDYCNKIINEAQKLNVKTEEGKRIKEAYIDRIEYSRTYLINNWNNTDAPLMYDKDLAEIDNNISTLINQFLEKQEEARNKSISKSNGVEFMYLIFGLIVGTILFFLLNTVMDVYYFGCSGIFLTWVTCVGISAYIIGPIVGELITWGIGIGLIVLMYQFFKKKKVG